MLFFKDKKAGSLIDEIRCDEPSYLIWKWHPAGIAPGKGTRENAIRWGSSLRVRDGEVAVFVYSQYNGTQQEYIEGPCDRILDTENLPVLASLVGLAYGGGTPFQAEVYFINLAQILQVKFGVPFFDVYDPRFTDFGVPVAVRGTVSFSISDYRAFVKLHRLSTFHLEDFQRQIRDAVSRYVKDIVANAPAAHNIPVIQMESKIAPINDEIEYNLGQRLKEDFGVTVSGVDIGAIEIDKASEGYRQLMKVTRDMTAARTQADTQDYTERLRMQREESQYAIHKQTQSAHLGAFQVEKQAEVGVAGAQALGQMGNSGAGGVMGDGFHAASMMAGMAIGGAVGQNIAGAMNSFMQGTPPVSQAQSFSTTPPPIPSVVFHVAVNGQATGPYDLPSLAKMAAAGQLNADSLVWKAGMKQWEKAGVVNDLKDLFIDKIPPIPSQE